MHSLLNRWLGDSEGQVKMAADTEFWQHQSPHSMSSECSILPAEPRHVSARAHPSHHRRHRARSRPKACQAPQRPAEPGDSQSKQGFIIDIHY